MWTERKSEERRAKRRGAKREEGRAKREEGKKARGNERRKAGKSVKIRDFRDLNVYRAAFDSAMSIFELTKSFPVEERYSLTDQIRRSSRSVCANIAEAWRKRRYAASFVNKLSDADAEAAETQVWLDMGLRCDYMNPQNHDRLVDEYHHICAQLVTMMSFPEKWCSAKADRVSRKP